MSVSVDVRSLLRTLAVAMATALAVAPMSVAGASPTRAAPSAAAVGRPLVGPAPAAAPSAAPAATPAAQRFDRTSRKERRRVDRVRPRLHWTPCAEVFRCGYARVPRDYDRPRGAKVRIALLKYPARSRDRIGTLFLNPGGPGGSGTQLAAMAPTLLPQRILDRFDVVGFDPRGVPASTPVRCFGSTAAQRQALAPLLATPFPDGASQAAYLQGLHALGRGCSTTGRPVSAAISSAEVARDLDVLRHAVGDRRLSYAGFSYGTALGQIYANLFPDRVRALVLDGVLEPRRWTGRIGASDPLGDRLRSADGAWRALRTILRACDRAGATACPLAARGSAERSLAVLAARLRRAPVSTPATGTITYPVLVSAFLGLLYQPGTGELITQITDEVLALTDPAAGPAARRRATDGLGRAWRTAERRTDPPGAGRRAAYDNSPETTSAIACTDTISRHRLGVLPRVAAAADQRAPYFGASWAWSLACARDTWKVRDEDAYRSGFRHRTRNPLLFVGNRYDPATRFEGAATADRLAPHSRLVASLSWGHTAFGTSRCVDDAIVGYLLRPRAAAPAVTRCRGDYQPFTGTPPTAATPVQRLLTPAVG